MFSFVSSISFVSLYTVLGVILETGDNGGRIQCVQCNKNPLTTASKIHKSKLFYFIFLTKFKVLKRLLLRHFHLTHHVVSNLQDGKKQQKTSAQDFRTKLHQPEWWWWCRGCPSFIYSLLPKAVKQRNLQDRFPKMLNYSFKSPC